MVDDEGFSNILQQSLVTAIKTGARRISEDTWKTQPLMLRLASWLSYGFVRFLRGIAGYTPGKSARS